MNRVDFERQYWEKEAKAKDVARQMHDPWLSTEEEVKLILAEIPKITNTVLEIGCGIGRLLIPIAKARPDANVFGIDISESLVKILNSNPDLPFNSGADLTDGRTIPEIDIGNLIVDYDFIYSVTVFQHIDQEGIESYFSEVGKILRKGGVFFFQFIEGYEHEPMSHHYSMIQIINFLNSAKLEIKKVDKGLIHHQWTWITAKKL